MGNQLNVTDFTALLPKTRLTLCPPFDKI